jgi:hypothetical protein
MIASDMLREQCIQWYVLRSNTALFRSYGRSLTRTHFSLRLSDFARVQGESASARKGEGGNDKLHTAST